MEIFAQISEALQKGDDKNVIELTQSAINDSITPKQILDEGLILGMSIIGDKFKNHEIFLPEVLMAAKAMHAGMDILKPLFLEGENKGLGKVVVGTVKGDLHDIGKNLVSIMLKGAGFEVIDLGKDVSAEKFVDTAIEENADVIGMSALLTTTMHEMKRVIEILKEKNPDGTIKTIAGGAPLSENITNEFGIDSYAFDATSAVERIKMLIAN